MRVWYFTGGLTAALLHNGQARNMNDRPYVIANGDKTAPMQYSTEYESEFFDVYSPTIKTLYSQVYWVMQEAVRLPEEIIERFKDKVIAIRGYEVDQVRQVNGKDVSVPITWAYNHHYLLFLEHRTKELDEEKEKNYRNHAYTWSTPRSSDGFSTSEFFSEGNGGEFRSSYHGYPKGYAQLLWSPNSFSFNPMQIDTWNRAAMKDTTEYHPGPLPQSSRIPTTAGYSGLIECPCSDRMKKDWGMTYGFDSCEGGDFDDASECMKAAKMVIASNKYKLIENEKGNDKTCSVEQHRDGSVDVLWNTETVSSPQDSVVAFARGNVNLTVALGSDEATIHMTGPRDVWFGIGLGATTMCLHQQSDECPDGGPYAITVSGDTVTERKLDQHGPGHVLDPSVNVKSNQVNGKSRTVVLTRKLKGLTDEHYTFDTTKKTLDVIDAHGCGLEFARHCKHGSNSLYFFQVDKETKLCRTGIQGTINGQKFPKNRCPDAPTSDLKQQNNPTCTIQTYRGGLSCCHHLTSLLDEDQEIPWQKEYLEYRFKLRFYFEEYKPATATAPASHQHLTRVYRQTEAFAGEYDIPQCSPGTPPDQCVHTITSRFELRQAIEASPALKDKMKGLELIYAGPHCHAPTCLSMDLYNADTGELLCHVEPMHATTGGLYYEKGFLAIPPCLWGSREEGLVEPILLPLNTTLLSVKRNNNTLPHTGEMASWQMRGALVPKDEEIVVSTTSAEIVENIVPAVSVERVEETKKSMLRAGDPSA